jgi:hypothetical protein
MVNTRTKVEATHPYYSWTTIGDQIFLDILGELLTEGNGRQSDGKISGATINTAMERYNTKTGANITRVNYDSRQKTWRTMYKNYSIIAKQSGWG